MSPVTVTLDDITIERIAHRVNALVLDNLLELKLDDVATQVIQRLSATAPPQLAAEPRRFVDARELAEILSLSRETVYAQKDLLGGIPIGDGPRPRWRFDVELATRAWNGRSTRGQSPDAQTPAAPAKPKRRARAAARANEELLPIRRHEAEPGQPRP